MGVPELRRLRTEEFADYATFVGSAFQEPPEAVDEIWHELLDTERFHVAVDGAGAIVGSGGAFAFTMSLPHGGALGCAGMTLFAVRADHRRQGLMRQIMTGCLADARERDEPLAALYASEGSLYRRFGFGIAVEHVGREIDRAAATPRIGDPGAVALVDRETARTTIEALFDAERSRRGGMVSRSQRWWDLSMDERRSAARGGWTQRRHAVVPGRGYALYRCKEDWTNRVPTGRLQVEELLAADAEAYASLLAFLQREDLVATIRLTDRPVDDPLRLLVDDEARVREISRPPLWLRLVDLRRALAERSYAATDTLVLEVADDVLADNAGTWRLEATPDGASCTRTDAPADLRLDAASLASAYLGGIRPTALQMAGLVAEPTSGAVVRLDRLLHAPFAPWCVGDF